MTKKDTGSYFYYARNQRQTALTVLANAILAGMMWIVADQFIPQDQQEGKELVAIMNLVAPIVISLLAIFSMYLYLSNKTLLIQVTPAYLHYQDPLFSSVRVKLATKDITEVVQTADVRGDFTQTLLKTKDGGSHRMLLNNYRIDRPAFFAALKKANPTIELPEQAYLYTKHKPSWVKRWRK